MKINAILIVLLALRHFHYCNLPEAQACEDSVVVIDDVITVPTILQMIEFS
jgi:hypothetical protein